MRLFEVDTLNQMIDGELVEDAPVPATWLWTSRYYLHDGVMNGDQFAVEAWERQTTGGILNEEGPGVYAVLDCDTTVEKVRLPRAAR